MRLLFSAILLVPLAALADGPVWSPPAHWPPLLRDVASRLPEATDARDKDLITYTHEATHFLSRWRAGGHGVYIGDGARHYLPTPPLRTADVLAAVPESRRGSIYHTYYRQSLTEYWRDQPLMIIDEWNAYTHGCITRRQLSLASRRETDVHCHTFAGYAEVLCQLADRCDGYDMTELLAYCRWNLDRCKATVPDMDWNFQY